MKKIVLLLSCGPWPNSTSKRMNKSVHGQESVWQFEDMASTAVWNHSNIQNHISEYCNTHTLHIQLHLEVSFPLLLMVIISQTGLCPAHMNKMCLYSKLLTLIRCLTVENRLTVLRILTFWATEQMQQKDNHTHNMNGKYLNSVDTLLSHVIVFSLWGINQDISST